MAGFKDLFRSRSKSRARASQDIDSQRKVEQQEEEKSQPPLALLRADSVYPKKPEEQRPVTAPNDAYESFPSGDNTVQQGLYQPLSPTGGYESFTAGIPPTRGTYPLHGNAEARPPTARAVSKSPSRASRPLSVGSSRRFSRQSAGNRQSLPPGTAITADEPIAPTPSPPRPTSSSSPRIPVSNLVSNMYRNQPSQAPGSSRGTDPAPAVPSIPGQFRPQSSPATYIETPTQGRQSYDRQSRDHQSHNRVVSSSSRMSNSSRTPIAEQFASTSWYDRNDSPSSSPVKDTAASDEGGFHHPIHRNKIESPLFVRDRIPRRSLEKPLPVPQELQDAPWNRENQIPTTEPLQSRGGARQDTAAPTSNRDVGVNNLASQMQPLSLQDQDSSARSTIPDTQHSGTIRDFSDVPDLSGGMPEPSPDETSFRAAPFLETPQAKTHDPFVDAEVKSGRSGILDKSLAVKNAAEPVSLKNVVDTTNTEDTSVHVRNAPAVVHETVLPQVHHIRHEQVTREIHTHDVYHRELPIIDVQVLPARHFIPTNWIREDSEYHPQNAKSSTNGLVNGTSDDSSINHQAISDANAAVGFTEVPHHLLPKRTIDKYNNKNWIIAETASKLSQQTANGARSEPQWRHFSAKAFPGTEGDYEEWVGEDGVRRSGQTWVHHPTHDMYLKNKGMTQPLYMDECDGSCGGKCGSFVHKEGAVAGA